MIADSDLAKMLLLCNSDPEFFEKLHQNEKQELKYFCMEIVKYGGITHEMAGGKRFTDNTLLRPAKNLVKTLKRKKE